MRVQKPPPPYKSPSPVNFQSQNLSQFSSAFTFFHLALVSLHVVFLHQKYSPLPFFSKMVGSRNRCQKPKEMVIDLNQPAAEEEAQVVLLGFLVAGKYLNVPAVIRMLKRSWADFGVVDIEPVDFKTFIISPPNKI